MRTKLETLYTQKTLGNMLYTKKKIYSYKFQEKWFVTKQLKKFNKLLDLENVVVKLANEDKAILFLNVLSFNYEYLVDGMLYGRVLTITLDEVVYALKSKLSSSVNE